MVGNDRPNRSIRESFPEPFAIRLLANRRATFKLSGARRDLLRREMQIVRTRLRGNPNSLTLRLAQHRHRIRRGKMNDVNARVELTTQPNHQLDRFILRRAWPRL